MHPDRYPSSKRSDSRLSGPYAGEKQGYAYGNGTSTSSIASVSKNKASGDLLSRILSKLGHLDLSNRILDRRAVKDAHGGYCDVFVGYVPSMHVQDRRVIVLDDVRVKIAIKRLRISLNREEVFAKRLAREMEIWSRLDHPNILPFLGYALERGYPSLISEWMEFGTAGKFLTSHPDTDITRIALGIAEGLQYMHDKNLVHSDLKADNVLIGPSQEPLICDFGISRMLSSSEGFFASSTSEGGTRGSVRWMAIELFLPGDNVESSAHSKATDVWAFGMTLYEMLTRDVPYTHLKYDVHVLLAVMRGELPNTSNLELGANMSPFLYPAFCAICRDCWATNPGERPTMAQITGRLSSLIDEAEQQHRSRFRAASQYKQFREPFEGQQSTEDGMNLADWELALTPAYRSYDRDPINSTLPNDHDDMVERALVATAANPSEINDKQSKLELQGQYVAGLTSMEGVTVDLDGRLEALDALATSLDESFQHGGDMV